MTCGRNRTSLSALLLHKLTFHCTCWVPPRSPLPFLALSQEADCRLCTNALRVLCLGWTKGEHQISTAEWAAVRSGFFHPGFLSVTQLEAGCVPQPEACLPSSCQTASPVSSSVHDWHRFLEQLALLALKPCLVKGCPTHCLTAPTPIFMTLSSNYPV